MSARTTTVRPKPAKASSAPVQLKKRPKTAPREPLFSIDGVDYMMPVTVEFGYSLAIKRMLRAQPDEDSRGIELVRELCGQEALAALLADSTMTESEWRRIVQILTEKVFGPAEAAGDSEGN